MIRIIPYDWIPVELQPLLTLALSWVVSLYGLNLIPPSNYRRWVTDCAAAAFAGYWFLFAIGAKLGGISPYFGPNGIGSEMCFAAVMLVVEHSFRMVEECLYRRLVYVGRLSVIFAKDGTRILRHPPLIETATLDGPKPPAA